MASIDRRKKLRNTLEANGIDALLVSIATNVGYLTGFTGDSSALMLTADRTIMVSDTRYSIQLEEECPDVELVLRPIGQPMAQAVGELASTLGRPRVGFESHATTIDELESIRKASPTVEWQPASGLVEGLRIVKDHDELAEIRAAVVIAEAAFVEFRAWIKPGVTEKRAGDHLDRLLRAHGATAGAFPPIVAFGPRSAMPHARPDPAVKLAEGDVVLVDWGATGQPYKSDLTRMIATGKVGGEFESVYRAVLEAQARAVAAIRPGAQASSIDAAARSVLQDAGLGSFFTHATGHGIGRDVHEAPMLRHDTERELVPGMVVTVEPGVYRAGWGGVRIEDDVLVTADGCEVLSTFLAKTLDSVVL